MPDKYDIQPDFSDPASWHARVVAAVGGNKRVLEFGCGYGYTSEELVSHGCRVTGIELDPEAAVRARQHCEQVVVGDLETLDLRAAVGEARFDVALFGDVLEHLRRPVDVLRATKHVLVPGGFVVASIPNVAHGAVRLALLQGRFDYQPLGLLDDTHIRFFTRASVERLFADAGFVIAGVQVVRVPPFATGIPVAPEDFGPEVMAFLERDEDADVFEFLVKAVADDASGLVESGRYREEELQREMESLRRRCREQEAKVAEVTRWAEHLLGKLHTSPRPSSRLDTAAVRLYRALRRRRR